MADNELHPNSLRNGTERYIHYTALYELICPTQKTLAAVDLLTFR